MTNNIFRLLGDFSHLASKLILIIAIHRNKSAEGVSYLTQVLYLLVFLTRYLDIFWSWISLYNFVFKIFYVLSSVYVLVLMRIYPRSTEKLTAWRVAICSLIICIFGALIFKYSWSITEVLWSFSIQMESVCVLPQLQLLRQTSVPTVINSYYLVTLGSYRFLYAFNWIYRYLDEGSVDPIAIVFGVIQTLLYFDFAWVYYRRQRVKLRAGGVIDSEDLSQGFVLKRILGTRRTSLEGNDNDDLIGEDEVLASQEAGMSQGSIAITDNQDLSVRADDTLERHQAKAAFEIEDPDDEDEEDDSSTAAEEDHHASSHTPLIREHA